MLTRHRILSALAALIVLLTLAFVPTGAAHAAVGQRIYSIEPVHSFLFLNVEGASTADGARIIQWYEPSLIARANEEWYFDAVPNTSDTYYIRSYLSGKVLTPGSYGAGASVVQWTNYGWTTQQWHEEQVSSSTSKFRNVATGLYLDVSGASYNSGAPLIQWYQTTGLNQQFYLTPSN